MIHSALDRRSRSRRHGAALIALIATAIGCGGCSFDLSSMPLGSDKDKPAPASTGGIASPKPDQIDAKDAEAYAAKAQLLAQSGKNAEAIAAYGSALTADPYNAQNFYRRGLIYQSEKQYDYAIADFTSANGLTPQQPDPLIERAQSYVAVGKIREAAADLDEAVGVAPQSGLAWSARGAVYERLGEKAKAAESYNRAISLRPRDEAARNGLARVTTGKPG
jgi:tetratricopeptide (TPR) repeat protein